MRKNLDKIGLSYGCYLLNLSKASCKREIRTDESDNLPFPNETFDFVLFTAVIEHLYNPTKILNEINRILKKEGIIIISTTNYNHQVKEFWNDSGHDLRINHG